MEQGTLSPTARLTEPGKSGGGVTRESHPTTRIGRKDILITRSVETTTSGVETTVPAPAAPTGGGKTERPLSLEMTQKDVLATTGQEALQSTTAV